MRPIKFRAWDIKNKCFVGKNWHLNFSDGNIVFDDNSQYRIKDNFEIMQYTGLLDRKGTPIYEGDIVNILGCGKSFVFYDSGSFLVRYPEENTLLWGVDCDVIGNIWENQNLLVSEHDLELIREGRAMSDRDTRRGE